LFSRQAHNTSIIVEEEVSQDKPPSARDEKRTEAFMKDFELELMISKAAFWIMKTESQGGDFETSG